MPGSDDQRQDSYPAGELAQRLLRRVNDPAGVIDVRHGEELYGRTAGWVAQRFALLDHWKTRFGIGEGVSAGAFSGAAKTATMPLVEPSHPTVNRGLAAASAPASLMRSAEPAVPSVAPSATLPATKLRVKRPSSGYTTPPVIQDVPAEASLLTKIEGRGDPSPRPAGDSEAPVIDNLTSNVVSSPANPVFGPLSPMALQRKQGESAAAGTVKTEDQLPQVKELLPVREQSSLTYLLPKQSAGIAPGSSSVVRSPAAAENILSRDTGNENISAVHVNGGASSSEQMQHQRTASQAGPSDGSEMKASSSFRATGPATLAAIPGSHGSAVAREIRLTSLPGTAAMIWRKADRNGSVAPEGRASSIVPVVTYASGPAVMREISSSSALSAGTSSVEPSTSAGNGMSITRMAEEVSRIIARQLAIERERRGKTR